MAQPESTGPKTPVRSIRPRPIDVELAMPVVHFKSDFEHHPHESPCSPEMTSTTTTTISTTMTTTITTTTTTTTTTPIKGRRGRGSTPKKKKVSPPPTPTETVVSTTSEADDTICCICHHGGELVYCDGCPLAFHRACMNPPLSEMPKGPWLCANKHDEIYYQYQDPSNLEFLTVPAKEKEDEVDLTMIEIAIPKCNMVEDYDDVMDQVHDYVRPESYVVYQDKTPEEMELYVDYEMDSEDEMFLENLKTSDSECNLSPLNFEQIIHTLEIQAYKKKGCAPFENPAANKDNNNNNNNCNTSVTSVPTSPTHPLSTPPPTTTPLPDLILAEPTPEKPEAVSTEPKTKEEDIICCVCGDGDSYDTNMIVLCDGCDVAVHQMCYGIPQIPEEEWLCHTCRAQAEDPYCELCFRKGGAFKPTTNGKWAHLVCAFWLPEVSVKDQVSLEPIDISKVRSDRFNLECDICKTRGACLQCKERTCYTSYHPSCCLEHKYYMEIKTSKKGDNLFHTYCQEHSKERMEAEVKRAACYEGETGIEVKTAVIAVVPSIKKLYRLSLPTVEAICKYWMDKRRPHTQPLLRHLQNYTDFIIRQEKNKRPSSHHINNNVDISAKQQQVSNPDLSASNTATTTTTETTLLPDLKTEDTEKKKKRKRGRPPVHHTLSRSTLKKGGNRSLSLPGKLEPTKRKKREKIVVVDVSNMVPDIEVTEAENLHCHHCKKRRPRSAICPYNKTHRYCQNCVKRHFSIDYDDLAANILKYWKKGCPKCSGTCPCAVCRNIHGKTAHTINYTPRRRASTGTSSSHTKTRRRNLAKLFNDASDEEPEPVLESDSEPVPEDGPASPPLSPSTFELIYELPPLPPPPSNEKKRKRGKKNVVVEAPIVPMVPPAFPPVYDINCEKCKNGDDEANLILCDKCDKGFHLYCLNQHLKEVPQGTWYCDSCESTIAPETLNKINSRVSPPTMITSTIHLIPPSPPKMTSSSPKKKN